MRELYTSNYTGIPAYLMDFGFGGLVYARGVYSFLCTENI